MPRPVLDRASPAAEPFAAFWSEPVPAVGAGRQTRLVRAWEGPAESWRTPPPRKTEAAAGGEVLDRAQRALLSAGRPSIAAYARFGARAVR